MNGGPVGRTGAAVDGMSYDEPDDVAAVRSFVRSAAVSRGLPPARAELLVLAVSELATNTLQHTTGGGQVRVWSDDHQIVCEVVDGGSARSIGRMPAADSQRGRGLAIVERVVDDLAIFADPAGVVVQVRMNS